MMSNLERLAYMVNQIARNFSAIGEDAAASATADHIATYWDPRMRQQGFDLLDGEEGMLTPVAASALYQLRDRGAPPHQTRATEFNGVDGTGHADAG